jgi:hypothetical protein
MSNDDSNTFVESIWSTGTKQENGLRSTGGNLVLWWLIIAIMIFSDATRAQSDSHNIISRDEHRVLFYQGIDLLLRLAEV